MIYNQWYVILESKEIKGSKPHRIKRLNEWLAIWRNKDGSLGCIADKCCHRGASLSKGKVINGKLQCPFHGFLFDKSGKVTFIPANGGLKPVPETMRVQGYKTHEAYGLIWLWWGDDDKASKIPFFFKELGFFSYASHRANWNVHYSRAIENQLDVVHIPFVHKTTIGRGNKTLVNGPVVEREFDLLTFYVNNVKDDGKAVPLKPEDIQDYKKLFHLKFHFPNIWQNFISDNVRSFAAFVPVDEENTVIYIRYYQKVVTVPVVRHFINWIWILASKIILNQDKRVVETQLPLRSENSMDERLIMGDKPIIEYRKYRDTLKRNSI